MSVGGGGLISGNNTRHGNSVDAALSREVLNSITGMCRVITGYHFVRSSQVRLCLVQCFILSIACVVVYFAVSLYVSAAFNIVGSIHFNRDTCTPA